LGLGSPPPQNREYRFSLVLLASLDAPSGREVLAAGQKLPINLPA
jgi:hypothetical protein